MRISVGGRWHDLTSIAFSLAQRGHAHLDTAAAIAGEMVQSLAPRLIGAPMLLNVNFPALARADVRGVRVTRLGKRHVAEPVIKDENPRGETIYWIGPAGSAKEAGPGTDFHAVAEGWVSVTPLDIDLTGTKLLDTVGGWFPDGAQ